MLCLFPVIKYLLKVNQLNSTEINMTYLGPSKVCPWILQEKLSSTCPYQNTTNTLQLHMFGLFIQSLIDSNQNGDLKGPKTLRSCEFKGEKILC